MMLSAMLTLNVYKVPVWAVDKKQQVQNENKKLQEKNKKIQNEIKELDEKMTASHETYEKYRSKLSSDRTNLKCLIYSNTNIPIKTDTSNWMMLSSMTGYS